MTRKECLDAAAGCVLKDRQNQYGKPEDCFGMIAGMWTAYLGQCISAHDVAAMMILLKMARARFNPQREDDWIDAAGYAACGSECATAWEREGGDEAEGNYFQNGNSSPEADAEPEFKPGDRVQANIGPNGKWKDMVYHCKDFAGNHLVGVENAVSGGDILYVADAVRPAPEADEEPEFKPGDKVEVHATTERDIWEPATIVAAYRDKDTCGWRYSVRYVGNYCGMVPSSHVRPAPKAEEPEFKPGDPVEYLLMGIGWDKGTYLRKVEDGGHRVKSADGCEYEVELCHRLPVEPAREEFDAPQTPEELMERIRDCNPVTYGAK